MKLQNVHELFLDVLNKRDLSRAGDLFQIEDCHIITDLSRLIAQIEQISSAPGFNQKPKDQSVIEICLTRITSAIRDTGTIERHVQALVSLLESCLQHDLKPGKKDEDPPHAKIASDVISCIFLNHNKRNVLELAMPVAIKLLHRGNRELSRNLSSYLSLAAINHAEILAPHVQPLIDSIIGGNHTLAKVLPKIYSYRKEPIQDHVMALVCLLPQCDTPEKLSLLNLFALIAKSAPRLLESNLPELSECLCNAQTAYPTLQIFLHVAQANAKPFPEHLDKVIRACELQHGMLSIAAQFIGLIGRQNNSRAYQCVSFLTSQLSSCDLSTTITILREIRSIGEQFPSCLSHFLPQIISQTHASTSSTVHNYLQQLSALSSQTTESNSNESKSFDCFLPNSVLTSGHAPFTVPIKSNQLNSNRKEENLKSWSNRTTTPHWKLSSLVSHNNNNNISSTINSPTNNSNAFQFQSPSSVGHLLGSNCHTVNRSVPRLPKVSDNSNLMAGRPLSCSMGRVHRSLTNCNRGYSATSTKSASSSLLLSLQEKEQPNTIRSNDSINQINQSLNPNGFPTLNDVDINNIHNLRLSHLDNKNNTIQNSLNNRSAITSGFGNLTNVNGINSTVLRSHSSHSLYALRSNTIPSTARDAMRTFCEKHLDKIKTYMERLCVRLPLPVKCTIEQRKSKKAAKLHFTCDLRSNSSNCLFARTSFCVPTRNTRTWIHLMFLALQAGHNEPLYSSHPAVQALASCWEMFCKECTKSTEFGSSGAFGSTFGATGSSIANGNAHSFLTLVTGAFPSAKQHEQLLLELRSQRYFDVFEFNAPLRAWNCFICNHPQRAGQLLSTGEPIMQGQLKEKRAKWKLFRRWRTRYFTLSGTSMAYRELDSKQSQFIEMGEIRSVRAVGSSRGRNIPKAFEIFTNEHKSYLLKAKNSKFNEQWVQCLSIAMAHSQAKEQTN